MSTTPEPFRLGSHHRNTLVQILRHPAGHNIEWRDVLALLHALGATSETHDGKYLVTLGNESETFETPSGKDIDVQQVVDLRRMLRNAGYGIESEHTDNEEIKP